MIELPAMRYLLRLLVVICTMLAAAPSRAEGIADKPLVVGSEQDYPPFALGKTDATADGFTVELWKAIADDSRLNYTLRVLPFHQLLEDFRYGRIDVLINLAQSDERRKFADFTVPHVTVHAAIFIRDATTGIRSESDLRDKSIIVVKADIAHEYAVSQGWQSRLILVPTAADGLQLLASGKHDAMFVSKLVGLQTLEQLKLQGITALPVMTGTTQKFSFAVKKGNADLLARLNEGLALSKSSGIYDQLYHKWFGVFDEKKPSLQDTLKYLLPLLAGFISFVGFSYFRQRKAMQQLAESHHMLQTVIETIPMRIFWKDRDSRFLGCNTLFAKDGGAQTPADVIGRLDSEMSWREQAELYRADDRAVIESGRTKQAYDEPQTTPAGTHWIRTSKTPLHDLNRQVIGVLGIYYDVSHLKEVEQALLDSESRLKSLFDNMTNGFALHEVIRNAQGKVVNYRFLSVNAAFEQLTGLSSAQVVGNTVREILPGIENHWIETYGNVADTGISQYLENYSTDIGRWFSAYAYRPAPDHFAVIIEDITERTQTARALVESESRLSEILENVSAYIYLKDTDGRYLFANKPVRELWHASMDDIVGCSDEKFFDAETAANIGKNDQRVLRDGETIRTEETNTVIATGVTSTYWSVKLPLRRENGEIYALCGISTDISEVKRAQEQMLLASMVYENSSESMMVTDADGGIITINPAFTQTTGYSLAEVRGKNPRILNSGRHDRIFFEQMWQAMNTKGQWQGEVWDKRKNGEIYPKWLTINTTFNADGTPYRRVALFSDITEKKATERIIWQQANFDSLTGLPNRRMFLDRLSQQVKKASRNKRRLALLFIDLDRFKEINDTLGHDKGDMLLVQAAQRLQSCIRDSDTVARLGGDEFTIILGDLDDNHGVDRIIQNILQSMAAPFSLQDELAYVSGSIGITIFPEDADSIDTLIRNADQAMYMAKHQGRNRFCYFTPAMEEDAKARMRLSNDLRVALAENQFWVAYQPIIDLATGNIHKAEALIRWQHPTRGLVNPAEFIPIAEETGSIIEIGNWVFLQAANQVARWRQLHRADFQISVNKSPVQFINDGSHTKGWLELMQDIALPAPSLVVEITEGLLLHANQVVDDKLIKFRERGMEVAIDDFGTGYSSLAYLKKFDIDYLKIDRSFVANLGNGNEDYALCEAIIVMAHKLGIKVIAEGIETGEQQALLAAAGCDYGQGYYFSRPLTAAAFEQLLSANPADHGNSRKP